VNKEWFEIPTYDGRYMITKDGRIKSKFKELKQVKRKDGYKRISLTKNGKRKNYLVHRVIAMTFIPNSIRKKEVNHKDGNKRNNHVSNLEWCTREENIRHASSKGLMCCGEDRKNSRLTWKEVLLIRKMLSIPNRKLASLFGVSPTTILKIKKNIKWKRQGGKK